MAQILRGPNGRDMGVFFPNPLGVQVQSARLYNQARESFPNHLGRAKGKTAIVIGGTGPLQGSYGSASIANLWASGFERIINVGFSVPPKCDSEGNIDVETDVVDPGWIATSVAHQLMGDTLTSYIGNGFSDELKSRVVEDLVAVRGGVDAVFYSVAANKRTYGGMTWQSALKVIGDPVETFTLRFKKSKIWEPPFLKAETIEAASPEEIEGTEQVMGGYDLLLWVAALEAAGLLNPEVVVAAYSYIGPQDVDVMRRVYWDGAIGKAKKHIEKTIREIDERLRSKYNGRAYTVVDPAVVTVASSVIPGFPNYMTSFLGGAPEAYRNPLQVKGRFIRALYSDDPNDLKALMDSLDRVRLDDHELAEAAQKAIREVYEENLHAGNISPRMEAGLKRFRKEYLGLFYGFEVPGVDQNRPVSFDVSHIMNPRHGVINLNAGPVDPKEIRRLRNVGDKSRVLPPTPREYLDTLDLLPETTADDPMIVFMKDYLAQNQNLKMERSTDKKGRQVVTFEVSVGNDLVDNYAAITHQPQNGTLPTAMDFSISFPGVVELIQDDVAAAGQKTIIHVSESIERSKPIPAGKVKVKIVYHKKKESLVFLKREISLPDGEVLSTGETQLQIGGSIKEAMAKEPTIVEVSGEPLFSIPVTAELRNRFKNTSGDHNLVHDDEKYKDVGLPHPILHGICAMALTDRKRFDKYTADFQSTLKDGDVLEIYEQANGSLIGVKTLPDGRKGLVITLTNVV